MIAIIGAGVSGLTCGVVLSEAGHDVTIFGKEIENTTSHAAGAIWFAYHIASPHVDAWANETREVLVALMREPEAGVSMIDFHVATAALSGRGAAEGSGTHIFHVPLMDTTRYLPYLRRRFRGAIVQREIRSFDELDHDVIVNCAGFGARTLCDDAELTPGYGIAVVSDRPAIDYAIVTDDPLMYVIPRTDDCVLGGYDSAVPPGEREAAAIVERCRAAVPQVSGRVLAVRNGIRPVRPQVRLEWEPGKPVIHNYGHGGAGFTVSWGCAREVARLLGDAVTR
jgi:D-amino-acid oxidase